MNDNTSAFPIRDYHGDGRPFLVETGMSLRDWFAGQALAGYSATSYPDEGLNPLEVACYCYTLADAMLKVRGE